MAHLLGKGSSKADTSEEWKSHKRQRMEERARKDEQTDRRDPQKSCGRLRLNDFVALEKIVAQGGCHGFLVSCSFKREISATIEFSRLIEMAVRDLLQPSNTKTNLGDLSEWLIGFKTGGNGLLFFQLKLTSLEASPLKVVSKLYQIAEASPPRFFSHVKPVEYVHRIKDMGSEMGKVAQQSLPAFRSVLNEELDGSQKSEGSFAVLPKSRDSQLRNTTLIDSFAACVRENLSTVKIDLRTPSVAILCDVFGSRKSLFCAVSFIPRSTSLLEAPSAGLRLKSLHSIRSS
mmetsp:Transcript_5910/g.10481  ORF Transcript_5910/g.10481 Transcript_5910/m.10481 type:complete len:289 (-) Transcript_5910:432-1298(-)